MYFTSSMIGKTPGVKPTLKAQFPEVLTYSISRSRMVMTPGPGAHFKMNIPCCSHLNSNNVILQQKIAYEMYQ